jgi:FMN-dependent NADH-azoreductase
VEFVLSRIVKDYFDCVILKDKTIAFRKDRPYGLLDDRDRTFLYVQSSGGNVPWALRPAMNKGLGYVEDVVKFLGIRHVDELLVDDTGTTEAEWNKAVDKAAGKINDLLENMQLARNHIRTGW